MKSPSNVAPFTGAWIEIVEVTFVVLDSTVAPFTGAWIEIGMLFQYQKLAQVAPFTGAWIEIDVASEILDTVQKSLPSRGRGLKFRY